LQFKASPDKIVHETISRITKAKWTGEMAPSHRVSTLQVESPEFKPQSYKKKKKNGKQLAGWHK
jgi:hypothetical protein